MDKEFFLKQGVHNSIYNKDENFKSDVNVEWYEVVIAVYTYWWVKVLDKLNKMIIPLYFVKKLKLFSSVFLSVMSVDRENWKINCCVFVGAV